MRLRDQFTLVATLSGMGLIVAVAVAAVTLIVGLVSSWLALQLGFQGAGAAAAATIAFIVGISVVFGLSLSLFSGGGA